jgi:hypothetical protein
MKRVGYDADSGKYFYRDKRHLWEGQEGERFGKMTRGTYALFNFFQMTWMEYNIKLQSGTLLGSPTAMEMMWQTPGRLMFTRPRMSHLTHGIRMAPWFCACQILEVPLLGSPKAMGMTWQSPGRLMFTRPRTAHLAHGIRVAPWFCACQILGVPSG